MNEIAFEENPQAAYGFRTAVSLALFVFVFTALLGFSLYLDLKPANAIIVHDAIALKYQIKKSITDKILDFVKATARAFAVAFIANLAVKLVQQLESVHVIRNILYYSDALEFNQYIGNKLNKYVIKPRTAAEAERLQKQSEVNLGDILFKANLKNFNNLPSGDVARLALLGTQSGVGDPPVVNVDVSINAGAVGVSASFDSRLSVSNTFFEYGTTPNFGQRVAGRAGSAPNQFVAELTGLKPETAYYLRAGAQNVAGTGFSSTIRFQVNSAFNFLSSETASGPSSSRGGFTEQDEAELLVGSLAMLTSQAACGATNDQAVRNTALYFATKARGFDVNEIDPADGVEFYRKMAILGSPFATPSFVELAMRDAAMQVEGEAKAAATTELLSSGQKAVRSDDGGSITRTGKTISDLISNAAATVFDAPLEASGSAHYTQAIGQTLANLITSQLLSQNGVVYEENPYCGVATDAARLIPARQTVDTSGGVPDTTIPDVFANAFIRVNGKSEVSVRPLERVTLSWDVGTREEIIGVSINDDPVGRIGSELTEPITKDMTFVLSVSDKQFGKLDLTVATVELGGSDAGGVPDAEFQVIAGAESRALRLSDQQATKTLLEGLKGLFTPASFSPVNEPKPLRVRE